MTKEKDYQLLNGLALAYVGDAIYEVYIRDHLIQKGQTKPNRLHHLATAYVSAKGQAFLMKEMLQAEMLSAEEEAIYKRGRNAKSFTSAKNTDITTYRIATGFEALMGYLHLSKATERLEELINWSIHKIEERQENEEKNKG